MTTAFDSMFRPRREYVRLAMEILSTTIHRHKLKAHDICVIATLFGLVGTEPIRRTTKIPETAESIIKTAMDIGKDSFKDLARAMTVVPHPRNPKRKKGLFN